MIGQIIVITRKKRITHSVEPKKWTASGRMVNVGTLCITSKRARVGWAVCPLIRPTTRNHASTVAIIKATKSRAAEIIKLPTTTGKVIPLTKENTKSPMSGIRMTPNAAMRCGSERLTDIVWYARIWDFIGFIITQNLPRGWFCGSDLFRWLEVPSYRWCSVSYSEEIRTYVSSLCFVSDPDMRRSLVTCMYCTHLQHAKRITRV